MNKCLIEFSSVVLVLAPLLGCAPSRGNNCVEPPDPVRLTRPGKAIREEPKFIVQHLTGRTREKGNLVVYDQPNWEMGTKRICQLRFPWGGLDEWVDRANVMMVLDTEGLKKPSVTLGWAHDWRFRFEPKEFEKWGVTNAYEYVVDEKQQEVRYRQPYRARQTGKLAWFTYTMKATGKPGEVAIDWQSDEALPIRIWWGADKEKFSFGTGETFQAWPDDEVKPKARPCTRTVSTTGAFAYSTGIKGCRVRGLPEGKATVSEWASEYLPGSVDRRVQVEFTPAKQGHLILDFGSCAPQEQNVNRFPAVNGLDFSLFNGIHFPKPATCNELRNPSFEAGLYHWTYQTGQGDDSQQCEIVEGGKFGKKALLFRTNLDYNNACHMLTSWLYSMPQQLENGATYTLSFYAKRGPEKKTRYEPMAIVGLASNSRNSSQPGDCHYGDAPQGKARFKVTDEWQRFERTFVAGSGGFKVVVGAVNGDVLYDGFQLERGDKATDFVAPSAEPLLVSSNPRNDLSPRESKNLTVRFTGQPGTMLKAKVSISNYYREKVYEETLSGTIGVDGTVTIPLSPASENIGTGVFPIRFDVSTEKPHSATATFYQRFSVMEPLADTKRATAGIIGTLISPRRYGRPSLLARKMREWGIGSISWGPMSFKDQPNADFEVLWKEGIRNVNTVIGEPLLHETNNYEVALFADRADICEKMPRYQASLREFCRKPITPEQRAALVRAQVKWLKRADPNCAESIAWWNEEEGGEGLVKDGKFEEYYQYQSSTVEAIKKTGHKFKTSMSSGVSSILDYKLYNIFEKYIETALKHGVRYDTCSFHAYGHGDGGRLGPFDFDAQVAKIVKILEKYDYPETTGLYVTEMGNEMQLRIPEWHTLNGDTYQYGMPEYSFGHYEALNAATCARIWIMAMKYFPRMRHTNVWNSRPFMDADFRPLFWCKAANTIAHLMPNQTFIGDIRPAADIRGYAFRRLDGTGIAAIWQTNSDIDESYEPNPKMTVNFTQDVRAIDLMENERKLKIGARGKTTFAVTMAPLFLTADDPEKLLNELRAGTVVFPGGTHSAASSSEQKGHALAGGEQEVINNQKAMDK